jgi:hypothetical protein
VLGFVFVVFVFVVFVDEVKLLFVFGFVVSGIDFEQCPCDTTCDNQDE